MRIYTACQRRSEGTGELIVRRLLLDINSNVFDVSSSNASTEPSFYSVSFHSAREYPFSRKSRFSRRNERSFTEERDDTDSRNHTRTLTIALDVKR